MALEQDVAFGKLGATLLPIGDRRMASVSVIIPARNNAETIGDSIDSCLSDRAVKEVLVVLHASKDGTREAALASGDPRVSVIEDDGRGISRAMNVGLAAATGAYVAKIDADDIVATGRFDRQSEFLDTHPDIMAVCGTFVAIDEAGHLLSSFKTDRVEGDVTDEYLAQRRPTHFGSWLCRREAWENVGGFREWFVMGEDLDMPFRLVFVGRVWFQPDLAYLYRIREGSITHTQARTLREFYEAQSVRFARQRLATGTDDLDQNRPPPLPEVDTSEGDVVSLLSLQTVGFLESRAWREFHEGRTRTAMQTMLRSVSYAKGWTRLRQVRRLLIMVAKSTAPRR
jgi:glycosyltransferase involved in cell wall biosynthesis